MKLRVMKFNWKTKIITSGLGPISVPTVKQFKNMADIIIESERLFSDSEYDLSDKHLRLLKEYIDEHLDRSI